MDSGNLLLQLYGGASNAATLFLVASGFTLVFGAMRVINLAHGSFFMYAAFTVATFVGASAIGNFWLALLVAPLVTAVLGIVLEVSIFRRIYQREHLIQLLATFALLLALADIALRIWGGEYRSIQPPSILDGSMTVLDVQVPVYNLFVITTAVVMAVVLWALLKKTRFGWQIRAAVEDPELLAASGTNTALLFTGVFALSAALAGLGGAVVGPLRVVSHGIDVEVGIQAFVVTVVGGLGSVAGAAVGAMLIGLTQAITVVFFPEWGAIAPYILLIGVLLVRPTGIFGPAERS